MKLLSFLSIIAVLALFSSCKNDDAQEPTNGARLVNTKMGGCNNGLKSLLVEENPSVDTLIYSFSGDSVKFFVGINYPCCAPFQADGKIENGVFNIYIKDVCDLSKASCYCNCMCYYTFDFIFAGCDKDTYPYKVYLFNPTIGSNREIFAGVVTRKV